MSLCSSKSPLHTLVYSTLVIISMRKLRRSASTVDTLLIFIALLKSCWMYWSEYQYIGSTRLRSLITKYRTDPLMLIERYSFLTRSISASRIVDSAIFQLISKAVYFAYSRDSINSTLSRIFSASASASYLRIVASDSLIDFL